LREEKRGFHDLLRQKTNVSVHIVGIELKLNGVIPSTLKMELTRSSKSWFIINPHPRRRYSS
jgi:hypothetical protein